MSSDATLMESNKEKVEEIIEDDVDDEEAMYGDDKEEENKAGSENNAKLARRIHDTITNKLLPELRKCLTKKVLVSSNIVDVLIFKW